jgi:hypothetical protein
MARRKRTKAEIEADRARWAQVRANAKRTRELAEKALAKLEAQQRATG